jgi:hypothetical protein
MPPHIAEPLVTAFLLYVAIGLAVALPFVLRAVQRLDPAAAGAGLGFRLCILPGAVALWPWVVLRWRRGGPPHEERNAHREAAR